MPRCRPLAELSCVLGLVAMPAGFVTEDARASQSGYMTGSLEVLIVCDDRAVSRAILDGVACLNVTCRVEMDATSLPDAWSVGKPGLIILDFDPPAMDGIAICRHWHERGLVSGIPVVLMLAADDLDQRKAGFQAGAADYWVKPVLMEEVMAKVSMHLRGPDLPAPTQYQPGPKDGRLVVASGETTTLDAQVPNDAGFELGLINRLPESDPSTKAGVILATGRRFTEHGCVQQALQRSEALYRSMFSAMVEGVIVQSRDGHLLSINPAAEKLLNLSPSKALGTDSLFGTQQVLTRDGKKFPAHQYPSSLCLRTGEAQAGVEMGLDRDDGEFVWILAHARPLFVEAEDKPYAVVSTFHDISERKKTEAEKLKSIAVLEQNEALLMDRLIVERRFSRMANHVPGFLYTLKIDATGHRRFVYVSSGVRDIYGLRPEDVAADMTPLREMTHPDDRLAFEAAFAAAIHGVAAFHHEYRICHPVKGVLWLEAKSMPTVKDDGSIVFHGFIQDISPRKTIESTLKLAAQSGWQENRDAFLASLVGFIGRTLDVDYVSIGKLTADPEYVETVVVYHRGEILPNVRYHLAETPWVAAGDIGFCCYPDHAWRQFPNATLLNDIRAESYAGMRLRDSAGNAIGMVTVMDGRTMTDSQRVESILQLLAIRVAAELERERCERVLADSRQFLSRVIDTIAEPVFVKDRRHRWMLVNAAFCKMMGQSEAGLLGKSDYDYFPKTEADEFWARDERVFRSGDEDVNQELFTDGNGVTRSIITKKTRYIDDNGEAVLVGILLDITELKASQCEAERSRQQLRALAIRLEKLREDERKIIARELHDDLGQRLTALKLDLARLMLRFGKNNPQLCQQVEEMELDMATTIQIVRDVATQIRPSSLEMGIASALESLARDFSKRSNVPCRLRIDQQTSDLDDHQSTALFRIVQESLTNITRYAGASAVDIALSRDAPYYVLQISDNGVGFDANARQTGLGLIGIEERALSLGGDMKVETAPNQGLKLTVRIPLAYGLGEE